MPALVRLKKCLTRLTLKNLIRMALQETDLDSDAYWRAVGELRFRSNPQTIQFIQKFFKAHNWRKRVLAVNIICQLGQRDKKQPHTCRPYAVEESQKLLLAAIHDMRPEVVLAAIYGLGHRVTVEALPELLLFSKYEDVKYRRAVVFALGNYDNASAIDTLLILTTDNDDEVRDWATFALGSLRIEVDTPDLRERLWLNVNDANAEVAGEALVGLAIRKDPRVHDLVLKRLERYDPTDYFIQEAVNEMGCSNLSKALDEYNQK